MILHPELLALRADDSPQRLAQTQVQQAVAAWRATPAVSAVEADLGILAKGAALDDCSSLGRLFGADASAGAELVAALVDPVLKVLAQWPLGQVPLRHYTDDCVTSIMLARSGGATLALQASHGAGLARRPAPRTVSFSPAQTWERVLAGSAEADVVTLVGMDGPRAVLSSVAVNLEPGGVAYRDGAGKAQLLRRIDGTLVSLKLQRRAAGCGETREYDLADGRLVHQAAGTARDSRLELCAALLGRMGRTDAAPLLAAMAGEAGSASLRWQALRECLGLDTATGFAALCRIAADPADPLAAPAGALRARLIEDHPQLSGAVPCPA